MREILKVSAITFLSVFIPITLWNAGHLHFAQSCDPKFGCLGVFELLTLVTAICAMITSFSLSVARYVFVGHPKARLTHQEIILVMACCAALSIASGSAIRLAEAIGISLLVAGWALFSFLVGAAIFKLSDKYNHALHRTSR
ncbi:hypothetical protein ACQUWM_01580 [Marinobacter sp. DUT-3]|uniref:hypothetical protein n=1 Tax=Marinobacter sp. DUT-3 TaxID=3412036 RepID=UPI003D1822DE